LAPFDEKLGCGTVVMKTDLTGVQHETMLKCKNRTHLQISSDVLNTEAVRHIFQLKCKWSCFMLFTLASHYV